MTIYSIKEVKDEFIVDINGHTGFEENGKDIVCASISTTWYMTVNLIDNFGYNIMDLSINEETGSCHFRTVKNDITSVIIKTLKENLSSLEKQYPKFLKNVK